MATSNQLQVAPDYVDVADDSPPIEIVAGSDVDSSFLREFILYLQQRYEVQPLRDSKHSRTYTIAPSDDPVQDEAVAEFFDGVQEGLE